MIMKMQTFEFLFGLILSILLFEVIETPTTLLQKDSLSAASKGIHIVKSLITNLENEATDDKFEDFWDNVLNDFR